MPDDAQAASAKEQREKKRFPFFALFTFVACCFTALQYFKEIVERFDHSIEALAEALRHVDIFGLAGGYVDGLRLHGPAMSAGWAYPWEALIAGIQGMWGAMASGGWLAIVAGIFVLAIGVGASVWALAQTDRHEPNPLSVALIVVLGLIVSVAVGFVANNLIAQWFFGSAFARWIGSNVHALGAGLSYEAPPVALPRTLRELETFNLTPQAGPQAGDYHDAGAFMLRFIWSHGVFAIETLAIGIVALSIVAFGASKLNGIVATLIIPFAALAVLVIGATAAYALDHLILVPAIETVLKIATLTAAPVGVGLVALVLEKGHLALSFFESGKKLIGRE